jgi:hypothetical protein
MTDSGSRVAVLTPGQYDEFKRLCRKHPKGTLLTPEYLSCIKGILGNLWDDSMIGQPLYIIVVTPGETAV